MDEQGFLNILRNDPDNEETRLAYLEWIEATGAPEAGYVRSMRRRLELQNELESLDARLPFLLPERGDDWLDLAFPLIVRSPTVGRCYIRPTPSADPFVAIGNHVRPEQTVCLIETKAIYTEITAGHQGVVTQILVGNGQDVEYNQVLFRLNRPPIWW